MEEFVDCNRGERDSPEVVHHIAHLRRIKFHPDGILHPAVGHKDPESRQRCAYACEPGGCEMETGADFLPAEEHDGDKRRLHEERQQALNGKRRSENVAYKPAVVRPV